MMNVFGLAAQDGFVIAHVLAHEISNDTHRNLIEIARDHYIAAQQFGNNHVAIAIVINGSELHVYRREQLQ